MKQRRKDVIDSRSGSKEVSWFARSVIVEDSLRV
jgi:hypothetical protein